jgi:hypothetical protein
MKMDTKFILGAGISEFFHLGIGRDLSPRSQLNFTAGAAHSWGAFRFAFALQHRYYVGKISDRTNRRKWFCSQEYSSIITPSGWGGSAQPFPSLKMGIDFIGQKSGQGCSIDFGLGILIGSKEGIASTKVYPCMSFQYFLF